MEFTEQQKKEINYWLDLDTHAEITRRLRFATHALCSAGLITDESLLGILKQLPVF